MKKAKKFPFKKGQRVRTDFYTRGTMRRYTITDIHKGDCESGFRVAAKAVRCHACGEKPSDIHGIDSGWFKAGWTRKKKHKAAQP